MEFNKREHQYIEQSPQDNKITYYKNQQPPNNSYYQNPQQQPQNNGYYQNLQQQPPRSTGEKQTKEKDKKTTLTKKDAIIVTCVLLWIVASIVASILFVSITGNFGWGVAIVGQLVFISGVVVRISDNDKHGPTIYPSWILTGLSMIIIGIVIIVTKPAFLDKLWKIAPYLLLIFFFGLTLIGLYDHTIGEKRRKKRCTVPVRAEIIEHLRGTSYRSEGVYPLFRYTYNDVVYEERDGIHAPRHIIPPVGHQLTLYINENNPKDFYADWNGRNRTLRMETMLYLGLLAFLVSSFFVLPFVTQ